MMRKYLFSAGFALLVAAILWNLGTWFLGLPASSSHTMVGSIIGVGLANQFMAPAGSATSGVDWGQATNVGITLLVSPIVGKRTKEQIHGAMQRVRRPGQQVQASLVDRHVVVRGHDVHVIGCDLLVVDRLRDRHGRGACQNLRQPKNAFIVIHNPAH